jgi:hypothetical protein
MSEKTLNDQHLVLLGRIDGRVQSLVDGQAEQSETLQKLDARLREQEAKSAKLGALSGGVVSVGIALIVEGLKGWASSRGHGQ